MITYLFNLVSLCNDVYLFTLFILSTVIESDQEIPTLLHFAAKHGLEDLTCNILDTPGSSAAFQIENKDGHDPADLAELNGHVDLAEHMRTHFVSLLLTQSLTEYTFRKYIIRSA